MEMFLRIKWFIFMLATDPFKKLKHYLTDLWLKAWKKAIDEKYAKVLKK